MTVKTGDLTCPTSDIDLKGRLRVVQGLIWTLSKENVDVPDVKNGNQRLIFLSFTALTRQILTPGVKTIYSDSLCETEAFHQARHRTAGCYCIFMTSGTSACSLLITLGISRVDTVSYGRKLKVRSCYKIDVHQTFRSNPKLIQLEFKGQPYFSTIFVIHPSHWNIW